MRVMNRSVAVLLMLAVVLSGSGCCPWYADASQQRDEAKQAEASVAGQIAALRQQAPKMSAGEFIAEKKRLSESIDGLKEVHGLTYSATERLEGKERAAAEGARQQAVRDRLAADLAAIPTPETAAPDEAPEGRGNAGEGVMLFEERPEGEPIEIFKVGNDLAVQNGGVSPTVSLKQPYFLTEITTYHWNAGKGSPAGTIALRAVDGTTYGPWKAALVNGVYWVAKPNVRIPEGSYGVVDSNPSTWAQNADCGGQGMTWASAIPTE